MTDPKAFSAERGARRRAPEGEPVTPEALATLRHDLRTLATHVLGYSEMLIEEAPEAGTDAALPDLRRVHAAGAEVLRQINDRLVPDRGITARAHLQAAGRDLLPPVGQLVRDCEALRDRARGLGLEEIREELQKIHAAALQMVAFITDRLLGAGPPQCGPAPQPEAEPAPSPAGPPATAEPPAGEASPSLGRLLVVDDNETNRDMLGRRLEKQGYAAAAAGDGRQALAMLRGGGFDLVLLDILMPGMDGYQVLEEIKSDPELRDLPVIMISALDEIDSVVRCIERGAEDYLPKPFDPVLLRARVGACLEKKRLRDQELEYLRNVAVVTAAAAAVEEGAFAPDCLEGVARRPDALGRLATVFLRMAREVALREQRLREQVQQLRIEIDESRKARQVAEITGSDYFQELQQKAHDLRSRLRKPGG